MPEGYVSFIHVSKSKNMEIANLQLLNCSFGMAQALSLIEVSNISISNVQISDSVALGNHIIYCYLTSDIEISGVTLARLKK